MAIAPYSITYSGSTPIQIAGKNLLSNEPQQFNMTPEQVRSLKKQGVTVVPYEGEEFIEEFLDENTKEENFDEWQDGLSNVIDIEDTTLTLDDDHHDMMLRFLVGCTVTIPEGLRPDFSCGWSQDSEDPIVFEGADGVTITSQDDLLSSAGIYTIGGIAAFDEEEYRLYGSLA